jgi:hypothetical protein
MREMINAFNTSFGKPERKRPLRRPGCRYDNIKITLKETAWEIVHLIHLVLSSSENYNEPLDSRNCGKIPHRLSNC